MEHYGEWIWAIHTWINVVMRLWQNLMYVHVFSLNCSSKYCKQVCWDMTPFLGEWQPTVLQSFGNYLVFIHCDSVTSQVTDSTLFSRTSYF